MKILKLETADTGTIFYRIVTTHESTLEIKPLCRLRNGFLTIKYQKNNNFHIFKSEVGVNYLTTNQRETEKIEKITESLREMVNDP